MLGTLPVTVRKPAEDDDITTGGALRVEVSALSLISTGLSQRARLASSPRELKKRRMIYMTCSRFMLHPHHHLCMNAMNQLMRDADYAGVRSTSFVNLAACKYSTVKHKNTGGDVGSLHETLIGLSRHACQAETRAVLMTLRAQALQPNLEVCNRHAMREDPSGRVPLCDALFKALRTSSAKERELNTLFIAKLMSNEYKVSSSALHL